MKFSRALKVRDIREFGNFAKNKFTRIEKSLHHENVTKKSKKVFNMKIFRKNYCITARTQLLLPNTVGLFLP